MSRGLSWLFLGSEVLGLRALVQSVFSAGVEVGKVCVSSLECSGVSCSLLPSSLRAGRSRLLCDFMLVKLLVYKPQAFLSFDANGDRLLQRSEFEAFPTESTEG